MDSGLIKRAQEYVAELFAGESSGHDIFHTLRVLNLSLRIAESEGADMEITALGALLHDADDAKLFGGKDLPHAREFLGDYSRRDAVLEIISEVSFKGTSSVRPKTIEGMAVQDADRLDALGAIGAARTFAYGGSRGRVMHDPAILPALGMDGETYKNHVGTSLNHFYEKLLVLKDMMNTSEGRRIAEGRHRFLEMYLKEFLDEWDAKA